MIKLSFLVNLIPNLALIPYYFYGSISYVNSKINFPIYFDLLIEP